MWLLFEHLQSECNHSSLSLVSPTLTQYTASLSILPNQSNPQSNTAYCVFHCKHSFPVSTILSCPGSCHQTGCRPLLQLPARPAVLSVSLLLTHVPQGLHVWQSVPTLRPALTICLGHAVKSITAGMTLSLCFSLSWMGVSVAAFYDYKKHCSSTSPVNYNLIVNRINHIWSSSSLL